jgi:hypothetical protein
LSVVMMGLRPSFFLFLFIAALTAETVLLVLCPLVPAIIGTAVDGANGVAAVAVIAWTSAVVFDADVGIGTGAGAGAEAVLVTLFFAPFIFATWRLAKLEGSLKTPLNVDDRRGYGRSSLQYGCFIIGRPRCSLGFRI